MKLYNVPFKRVNITLILNDLTENGEYKKKDFSQIYLGRLRFKYLNIISLKAI